MTGDSKQQGGRTVEKARKLGMAKSSWTLQSPGKAIERSVDFILMVIGSHWRAFAGCGTEL